MSIALESQSRLQLKIRVALEDVEALTFASHQLSPEKHLLMPLWTVKAWEGEPVGAEGQDLRWVTSEQENACPRAQIHLSHHSLLTTDAARSCLWCSSAPMSLSCRMPTIPSSSPCVASSASCS